MVIWEWKEYFAHNQIRPSIQPLSFLCVPGPNIISSKVFFLIQDSEMGQLLKLTYLSLAMDISVFIFIL